MTTNTILLIILSLIVAAVLSYFQYYYKAKSKLTFNLLLAFLRFLGIFGLLLLLINPLITSKTTVTEKPILAVVVDNSSSVINLKADKTATELHSKLVSNNDLKEKYTIQSYQFDSDFLPFQQLDFKGKQTNLDAVAKDLKATNRNYSFPTVLISDGNQTSGNDYVYSFDISNKVFPVILGDTTKVLDLKINHLNVNKYAFLKNQFPVEVFLQYSGTKSITADFQISQGNSVLNKQRVSFSPTKNTAVINVLLTAHKTGTQLYKASLISNEKEINSYNNHKNFAVEVIDQKTNIAIISSINHPDIATLKRAIESNAQRKVTIFNPKQINQLTDYNVLILYQPTSEFKSIFDSNKHAGINTFIVTGTHTDFGFLNQQQSNLEFKMTAQKEDYLAGFNSQFNLFALDNIGFEIFPPLQNPYGKIKTNGNTSVLLSSKIRNMESGAPLLAFSENQGSRSVFLLGENSWKWRMESHIKEESFAKYDVFMDKIIQFLASNNAKKSLIVNHESFYNSGDAIEITAQYFNKNYEFDDKAHLSISLINSKTKKTKTYDLLKGNNAYKVNLDGLPAGTYNFTVKELNSKSSYSGRFEILDFDIEKQFVNPDLDKLKQLATLTQGKVYFPNQTDDLVQSLLADQSYKTIEKSNISRSPLIDWKWLLVLICSFFAAEWFIRKYNGLL
ncbi:hypothetical protein SAMN05443543_103208 [Flavobacterium flevense]|uniref:VWA domain-containing protein n=1 Tax=Flavobacterium flevense TaxID=983 RepID=A0A4Y4AVV7_9FLAO|nr:hypothetical protein [Flavobacterium flevense]GEC70563.1 hypothetical protein FFL01_01020 [Flavobacterium flevense]SHL63605.1 hypothetical protein SAMN05443543_103208 [Flavobacterium flevense]